MHEYIDAHNHLQDVLLTHDLDKALTAVRSLPVRWMVVNGTTETDWAIVHRLAKDLPFVIPSYGLHPWYLRQRSQSWAKKLYDYLVESPAAVGETGLDRWIKDYDFESQQAILRKHLAFAAELDRPLTVHCLRAWEELLDLLGTSPRLARGFLLHSYGGPVELVDSFVELGAYFSFSGYFLNENKKAKLALFCDIPADRLLVETDAPAMPLPPDRIEFPCHKRRRAYTRITQPIFELFIGDSQSCDNCRSRDSRPWFAAISTAFFRRSSGIWARETC